MLRAKQPLIFLYITKQLFTILMSQRMDMQLRGEASLNVSGRALRKDFILKLGSIKASGKALLGGRKFHSLQI